MDKVREVVQFTHDQIGQFRDLVSYGRKNADNFTFLSGDPDMNSKVEMLTSLEQAPWPIRIRDYVKARKAIDEALDVVRKEKRKDIADAYTEIYALLVESARKENVDASILKDVNDVIRLRSISDNILVLQNNASTDSYFQEEAGKINTVIQRRKIEEQHRKAEEERKRLEKEGKEYKQAEHKPSEVREPLTISLKTKQVIPLGSASDVDAYLSKLRAQLMSFIDNGDSVIIS